MKGWFWAGTLILLMGLAACGGGARLDAELRVDLSGAAVIEEEDTHGGWLGDGYHWVVMEFEEDISEDLAETGGWKELPLTENLEKAMAHHSNFPDWLDPSEGYYFFRDDHSESTDPTDDSELFDRYSYNYVLAIYDSQTRTLYYNETDT